MSTSKKILVFTIDEKYIPHLSVALLSFIDHHDPGCFDIGVIYHGDDDLKIKQFVDFFHKRKLNITIKRVSNFLDDINVGYHFNQVIFYRLLAAELFFQYSKILYVDSDVVFVQNIGAIFDVDLGSKALAAVDKTPLFGVPDYLSPYIFRYLASGLLLINTEIFVNNLIKDKCIEFLKTHYFKMPDQDALSFVVRDFISIDPSYSVETDFLSKKDSRFEFANNAKIIQFSGSSKPWHMNNANPYKSFYWHYRSQTPYKSFLPDDFSLINLIKYLLPLDFKRSLKKLIGRA